MGFVVLEEVCGLIPRNTVMKNSGNVGQWALGTQEMRAWECIPLSFPLGGGGFGGVF